MYAGRNEPRNADLDRDKSRDRKVIKLRDADTVKEKSHHSWNSRNH